MIPSRPVASPPVTNINPLIHPLPLIISPLLTSSLVNKLLSDPFFSPSPSRRRGLHSTDDAVGPVRHQPPERRRIVRIPTWSFLWCQFTSPRLNYLMGCGSCWCWQADHDHLPVLIRIWPIHVVCRYLLFLVVHEIIKHHGQRSVYRYGADL
jgi:hypothetical protein